MPNRTQRCKEIKFLLFIIIQFWLAAVLFVAAFAQQGDPDNGMELFEQKCAVCHGSSGEGKTAPSLVGCSRCDSLDRLFDKIDSSMPRNNPQDCVDQCAMDIAAYIFMVFNGDEIETSTTSTIDETTSTTTTSVPMDDGTTSTTTMGSTTTIPQTSCPAVLIYGDDSEAVELLRAFRDTVLTRSAVGRKLLLTYYILAPKIVEMTEKNEVLRSWLQSMTDAILPALQLLIDSADGFEGRRNTEFP